MNFVSIFNYFTTPFYRFVNLLWTIYDYIGKLKPRSLSKKTLLNDLDVEYTPPKFLEEEEIKEEVKDDDSNIEEKKEDDLMEGVDSSVKQVYFNKDEIVSMFNESKNKFTSSTNLHEKIYYFSRYRNITLANYKIFFIKIIFSILFNKR